MTDYSEHVLGIKKLPSAEKLVADWLRDDGAVGSLPIVIRDFRNAVLEAAAQDIHERGMKEAAIVVRRRKEDL